MLYIVVYVIFAIRGTTIYSALSYSYFDVINIVDKNNVDFLVILDAAKSFDKFNDNILLSILQYRGLCEASNSFRSDIRDCYESGGVLSNSRDLSFRHSSGSLRMWSSTIYTSY